MTGKILATKILLKEEKRGEKELPSGIIVPLQVSDKPTSCAIAVLVGTGTPTLPMIVKEGDKVLFPPHGVARFVIDEEQYLLLDLKDVLYVY